jgi:hypothetical protein
MGWKGLFFGVPEFDEPTGQRWALAMELLRKGSHIVYRGVGVSLPKRGHILVEVPSWLDVSQMPAAVALQRLDLGEAIITQLLEIAADFAKLASGRGLEIHLVDDWGRVCAERRAGATAFTDVWKEQHPGSA